MTPQEAASFLSLGEQAVDEVYEAVLFENKQFFISKVLVPKVFRARIDKIKRQLEAFLSLGLVEEKSNFVTELPTWNRNDVLESHLQYSKRKFELKTSLHRAESLSELILLVEEILNLHQKYAALWFLDELIDSKGLLISAEADEMSLLQELKNISANGPVSFEDLKKRTDLPDLLISEMKRLTLLYQK